MTIVYNTLQQSYLGYAAIFACISIGFFSLRLIYAEDVGPGYWALSFLLNGIGFAFWSEALPVGRAVAYLVGELFHVGGFMLLIGGAYRFVGNKYKAWNIVMLAIWMTVWGLALLSYREHREISVFVLKALRAIIFGFAGALILNVARAEATIGKKLAGSGLILWGIYMLVMTFIQINLYIYYGFLVGFHILAAFGMVAMVIDKIRIRAEKSEEHVKQLEGILPICSYCKKIRDEKNEWHVIEAYIENRSKAEFSHGICPDCIKKYWPAT
jgi:hypothetical protein